MSETTRSAHPGIEVARAVFAAKRAETDRREGMRREADRAYRSAVEEAAAWRAAVEAKHADRTSGGEA